MDAFLEFVELVAAFRGQPTDDGLASRILTHPLLFCMLSEAIAKHPLPAGLEQEDVRQSVLAKLWELGRLQRLIAKLDLNRHPGEIWRFLRQKLEWMAQDVIRRNRKKGEREVQPPDELPEPPARQGLTEREVRRAIEELRERDRRMAELAELAQAGLSPGEVDEKLAKKYKVSPRTIRAWRARAEEELRRIAREMFPD